MLSENLKSIVGEVVDSLIGSKISFTAHDVTKLVRARVGRDVNVPHYNGVRDEGYIVIKPALIDDYEQTSHTFMVDGKPVSAEVFHHFMNDAEDYDPNAVAKQLAADGVVAAPAPPIPPVGAAQPAGQVFNLDNQGRLLVQTAFVKHLGLEPLEYIHVHRDQNCVVLSSGHLNLDHLATVKVDKHHGYVYLSSKVLKAIGDANSFRIQTNGNLVEVRPA